MAGIEITTRIGCKNACVYCPQDKIIESYLERSNILDMEFNLFKSCIDKIPAEVEIIFSGMCEAWLNRECTEMVLYAGKKGHRVSVFTTLIGMTTSDIDLLEEVPFKGFIVHLPGEEGYEKIKVDDNYLTVLGRLLRSNIKFFLKFHGRKLHPKVNLLIKGDMIGPSELMTRAGNIRIKGRALMHRRKGIIGCPRNLSENILLPNGDVILCCMDYRMRHILGNLMTSDYDSLFRSAEFLNIKKGFKDEALDILCRHCEIASNIDLFAKACNPLTYHLNYLFQHRCLKNVSNHADFRRIVKKAILNLKNIHNLRNLHQFLQRIILYLGRACL